MPSLSRWFCRVELTVVVVKVHELSYIAGNTQRGLVGCALIAVSDESLD